MERRRLARFATATLLAAVCLACSPGVPGESARATPADPLKQHEYMIPSSEAPEIRERLKANGYTNYSETDACEGMTTFIVPYTTGNELIGVMGALGQFSNLGDGSVRVIGETEEPNQCP